MILRDLFEDYTDPLSLTLISGSMSAQLKRPDVGRPGLYLTGAIPNEQLSTTLVFGGNECSYLDHLDRSTAIESVKRVVSRATAACFVTGGRAIPIGLQEVCSELGVPLIRTELATTEFVYRFIAVLKREVTETVTRHATFVEVSGVGLMIEGESNVGKSEAALGLIERGHRLIADDIVKIRVHDGGFLEGTGVELTRHHMEIRGIGIINVAYLYGALSVRQTKRIDLIVKLEAWNDNHFYDRVGLEDATCDILGVNIPQLTLPVKPGRDVGLLLEVIALRQRLALMGVNAAKELDDKLQRAMLNVRE